MPVNAKLARGCLAAVTLVVALAAPLAGATRLFQMEEPFDEWIQVRIEGNAVRALELRRRECGSHEGRARVQCLGRFAALDAALGDWEEARDLFHQGRRLALEERDVLGVCVLSMIERDLEPAEGLEMPNVDEVMKDLCLRLEHEGSGKGGSLVTRIYSPVEIWAVHALEPLPPELLVPEVLVDQSWEPPGFHRRTLLEAGRLLTFMGRMDEARRLLQRVRELSRQLDLLMGAMSESDGTGVGIEAKVKGAELRVREAAEDARQALHLSCTIAIFLRDRSGAEGPCLESLELQLGELGPVAAQLRPRLMLDLLFALIDGNLEEAEAVLHRWLGARDDPSLVAIHQYFLGTLYLIAGRYEEAVQAAVRSLDISQGVDDRRGQIGALLLINDAYQGLGLPEAGMAALEEAEHLARELRSPEHVGRVRLAQAKWLVQLERLDEARRACEEAAELLPQDDLEVRQEVRGCQAQVNSAGGSMSVFADDPPFYRKHWLARYQARIEAGTRLLDSSPYEAVEEFAAAEAIVTGRDVARGGLTVVARLGRAVAEGRRGRCDVARKLLDEVSEMEGLDVWIPDLSGFGPLAATSRPTMPVDLMLATIYGQMGVPAKVLRHSERARSQAFLKSLGAGWLELSTGGAGWALQGVGDRCAALASRLAAREVPVSSGSDEGGWKELEDCEQLYRSLVTEIVARDPRRSAVSGTRVKSLAEVQEALRLVDRQMVVYFRAVDGYLVLVLAKDRAELVHIPTEPAVIDQRVQQFEALISSPGAEESQVRQAARDLYEVLWRPLEPRLGGIRVILVPHRQLNDLPFVALQAGDGTRLGERYTISYAPSASAWVALTQEDRRAGAGSAAVTVFGDPDGSLPGAAAAARTIAGLWNTQALLGSAASESSFRRSTGCRVLHLATHARVDDGHPFASYVKLAPGASHDGRLELREILGLNLSHVDLVVLATCRGSDGLRSERDDLSSLSRAFLTAGAKAVVAAAWPVDDEATAALMIEFHRALRRGREPDEALQEAQSAMVSRASWSEPYFWAGFKVVGGAERVSDSVP